MNIKPSFCENPDCPMCKSRLADKSQLEFLTDEVLPKLRGESLEDTLRQSHSEVHDDVYDYEEEDEEEGKEPQ